MNRSRHMTLALLSGLALTAALPWTLASCATSEDESSNPRDTSTIVPEAGAADAGDAEASADGGCIDASDPRCVTEAVTCDDAAWCPVPTNVKSLHALTAVWGSGKNDVWASGSGGTVIHWDGAAWTPTPLPTVPGTLPIKNTFHALWGSGPNDVWIAAATDVIFHTDGFKNGTATWERMPNGPRGAIRSAAIYAVWGTGADDVRFGGGTYPAFDDDSRYYVGNQIIKKASDAGLEWSGVAGTAIVHGLWGSSADDLWLIGDNRASADWQIGLTMRGKREGEQFVWSEVDSRSSVLLRGIWGSSATDVWAVGDQGTIRRFGPNATEWEIVESPATETLHSIWGAAPNDVWAVGESGTILHWDGVTWTRSTAAFPVNKKKPHLYGVWGSGPTDVWIVGDGIALRYVGNTGGSK